MPKSDHTHFAADTKTEQRLSHLEAGFGHLSDEVKGLSMAVTEGFKRMEVQRERGQITWGMIAAIVGVVLAVGTSGCSVLYLVITLHIANLQTQNDISQERMQAHFDKPGHPEAMLLHAKHAETFKRLDAEAQHRVSETANMEQRLRAEIALALEILKTKIEDQKNSSESHAEGQREINREHKAILTDMIARLSRSEATMGFMKQQHDQAIHSIMVSAKQAGINEASLKTLFQEVGALRSGQLDLQTTSEAARQRQELIDIFIRQQ